MFALVLIGLFAPQEADVEALLKQLADESIEVREKATAALIERGLDAEDRIKREMLTAQGEFKCRIEAVLFAIGRRRRLETVLPPLRRITMEAKDRPLKEVLEEFKGKSGQSLELLGSGESPVSVLLRNALPVEALDAICRAAGVGYRYRRSTELVVDGKYAETPRTFAGRYAVSATDLSVTSRATLNLAVFWPPEVRPVGEPVLEVLSAADDTGESLMLEGSPPGRVFLSPRSEVALPIRWPTAVVLKKLSEGATKIAVFKGRLRLNYVAAHFITFDTPDADRELDYDGVMLSLKNFNRNGDVVTFNLDLAGKRRHAGAAESRWCVDGLMRIDGHKVFVTSKGGAVSGPSAWTGGPTETGWRLNFTFENIMWKAAAIRIEVDGVEFEDIVDFELKDIPLPK